MGMGMQPKRKLNPRQGTDKIPSQQQADTCRYKKEQKRKPNVLVHVADRESQAQLK